MDCKPSACVWSKSVLIGLEKLARLSAALGGVLLTLITLMTCVSVVGRNGLGLSLVGDFELTGAMVGVAIALFMPMCQMSRGNIIVEFFTLKASARTVALLDRLGAMALTVAMTLLAWRTAMGGVSAWNSHSSSMLLGLPDWTVYLGMVPAMALTALIAGCQALAPRHWSVAKDAHPESGEGFLR